MYQVNLSRLFIIIMASIFHISALSMDDIESVREELRRVLAENSRLQKELCEANYRIFLVSMISYDTYDDFIEAKFSDGRQPFSSFITVTNYEDMLRNLITYAKDKLGENDLSDFCNRLKEYAKNILGINLDDLINNQAGFLDLV